MTRATAKRELKKGSKITHQLFDKDEWVELVEEKIRYVGGFVTSQEGFWQVHDGEIWAANWEIVN